MDRPKLSPAQSADVELFVNRMIDKYVDKFIRGEQSDEQSQELRDEQVKCNTAKGIPGPAHCVCGECER